MGCDNPGVRAARLSLAPSLVTRVYHRCSAVKWLSLGDRQQREWDDAGVGGKHPRAQAYIQKYTNQVDIQPWSYTKPVGALIIILVTAIYIYFK